MHEKPDSATAASLQAAPQPLMLPQYIPHLTIIFHRHQTQDSLAIPITTLFIMILENNDKKPSLALILLICSVIAESFPSTKHPDCIDRQMPSIPQ
jgi:hypothetical protein